MADPPGVPVPSGFTYPSTVPDKEEPFAFDRFRVGDTQLSMDLHWLATCVKGDNPFLRGATAALKGVVFYPEEDYGREWEHGYNWATRIKEGLQLLAFITEGEP